MTYPPEYLKFIQVFNKGRFFESHEILEKLWLQEQGEKKLFYQGLIQTAVAFHHLFAQNDRGAQYAGKMAREKLEKFPSEFEGMDVADLLRQLKMYLAVPNQPKSPKIKRLP